MTTRTALVGGGASGIGLATAQQLAGAGLNVVLTGRREPELRAAVDEIRQYSVASADYVVSDVSDPESAAHVVSKVERRFGALDVAVLNAGGPPPGRILQVGDAAWREAFELLLLGPLRVARIALPAMAAQKFGRVIVVTSTAVRQPQPDLAVSVVLRAAVTNAVKLLSREFATEGVTVNCVAPGATATDRRRAILENRAGALGISFAEMDEADCADIPVGRPAEPAEIASAIAFLASEGAAYINGTVLNVDGGRTENIL
jgi:3-oxoacyl-[acyl-carrier protein] reductase